MSGALKSVHVHIIFYTAQYTTCCLVTDKNMKASPNIHGHTYLHLNSQLNSDLCDAGTGKGHYNSHDVDGKLELKELGNAVIDIPAPHHCLDNTAEVIIGQNDV